MTDMLQAMKAGQTSSGMVQLAGGVEHIERIKPQPAPPPCPPGPAPIHCIPVESNAPMGPPVAVHEPAPGQREIIEVVPNQPLIFDFNPLDLKATQHDGSVTLTFPDGAQLELHDIVGPCGVQPTSFQLPDGTVITPSDLLQAFHLEVLGPCGLVAPTPIVPHEVPNTGFAVSPFEVGELGPGLYGLGPLWPTGFGYGAEFLRGTGGGLNVLEIQSATQQNLDFTSILASGGATPNVLNIEVFDLTDTVGTAINPALGATGAGNSITLTPQDVLNLSANEPGAVQAAGGGALSLWINGTAADTVTLSGSWQAISGPTTSGGQTNQSGVADDGSGKTIAFAANANNNTEMVGYTEYSATVGGKTAHVYVENAVAQAGHVHHA